MEQLAFGALLVVSLVAFVVQLVFDQPVVGALGLVLLAVPGYALTRATGTRVHGWPEVLLVTLGTALAVTVVLGTIASIFPAGLNARTLAALASPLPGEEVPVADATGRVLTQDVLGAVDLPGFDRSSMDGWVVRAAAG